MKRGIPNKSVLLPHFDLISELRSKREPWAAIVRQLKPLGVSIRRQSLIAFMNRKLRSKRTTVLRPTEPRAASQSLLESIKSTASLIPLKPYIPNAAPSSKPTNSNNPGFTRDPALPR